MSGINLEDFIEHEVKITIQNRLYKANTDLEKIIKDYNGLVSQLNDINKLLSAYDKLGNNYSNIVHEFIDNPNDIKKAITFVTNSIVKIKKSIDKAKNSPSFKEAINGIKNIIETKNTKFDLIDEALEEARKLINA